MSDYITQLQRQLDLLTKRVDGLVKPEAFYSPEYITVLAEYLTLPALRFLGAGGLGSAGEWRDLSGNGMDLTYNGNPTMSYTTNGAPFWYYDGTGDWHSHADDANFDITGTETAVNAGVRGLTLGCWVYFINAAGATEGVMAKFAASEQRSYYIARRTTGVMRAIITTDGSTLFTMDTTATTAAGTWYFVASTFWPSVSLNIWLNDTEYTVAAGVPASVFNSNALFYIACENASNPMTGRVAFPFVCACALSDAQITRLYNRSRGLFGV